MFLLNKIIAGVLDKLKAKNPVLYLVIGAILFGVYSVLTTLETQMGLPGWLSSAIPTLKVVVTLLGFGLNASTYEYSKK
jgi:hypothetical protein